MRSVESPAQATFSVHIRRKGMAHYQKSLPILVFLTLGFFFQTAVVHAIAPFTLDPASKRSSLAPYLEVLEDRDNRLTIGEVSSPPFSERFQPLNAPVFNSGKTSSTWWLRFSLRKATAPVDSLFPETEWFLECSRPFITSMRLYYSSLQGTKSGAGPVWTVSEAGAVMIRADSRVLGRRPVFRLPSTTEASRMFYVRAEDIDTLILPLDIATREAFLERNKIRMFWLGTYSGIILALTLYNIFLFFSLRDRSYLWYMWYIVFLALYFHSAGGILSELLPGIHCTMVIPLTFMYLGLALMGAGMFTRSFLLTRRNAPVMNRALLAFIAVAGVLVALSWALPARMLTVAWSYYGAALSIAVVASGLICWWRGFRPARFFLIATLLLIIGGLNYDLALNGVLPFKIWTFYIFQFTSALEAVLLSFALADRIKDIQRQHRGALMNERRNQEMAITDGLTGLYNSRYFHSQIQMEIRRAESLGTPLSLLLLDADNFKQYNDTWGHPEGDRALAGLGRAINTCVREKDMACRYGGEEFAVILQGSSIREATEVAERIRAACAEPIYSLRPECRDRITVSIGVAELIHGQDYSLLVERADHALYHAKREGKNRVVPAEENIQPET